MQTQPRRLPAPPARSLTSGVHTAVKKARTPPPILASDVLREDLAPFEPGRRSVRVWDGAVATIYLLVGLGLRLDWGVTRVEPSASAVCLAAAAATGVTAIVPFAYLWRAWVGGLVGAVVVAIGLAGGGPLALLASPVSSVWLESFRTLSCIVLPAALLFRSHYREYRRGRVLLLVAFALSAPFLLQECMVVVSESPGVARLGAALALAAVSSGLFAFASAPTTTFTSWCAQALIAVCAADLVLREFYAPPAQGAGPLAFTLTGLAFFASIVPMTLGLFQSLAAAYAPEARLVDVHQAREEPSNPGSSD
jgi:hypothetical protein